MIYYSSKKSFNFKTFKAIRSLMKIAINEVDQEQDDLIEYILNFSDKARTKNRDTKKNKKKNVLNTAKIFIIVEN